MKVDEAAVRSPFSEHPLNAVVGERVAQSQPGLEIVARTDIVAGEDVRTSETT